MTASANIMTEKRKQVEDELAFLGKAAFLQHINDVVEIIGT